MAAGILLQIQNYAGTLPTKLQLAIGTGTQWDDLSVNNPIVAGNWVQLIATYTSGTGTLFLNGNLVAQRNDMVQIQQDGGKTVFGGHWNEINNNTFNGTLDELRIYDRALSVNEVAALYQLENPPPDQNATVTGTVNYEGVIPGPTYVWALEANGSQVAEHVLPDGNGTYSLTLPKGRGYDIKVFVDGSQNGYPTNGEVWKHYGDWNSSLGGFNLIQVDGNLSSIDFTLADEDSDGDGFVNWHEHQAGTGINDANSTPGLDFGLVAYYPFDGNASDMSGNSHDGTVIGATLGSDRHGVTGKAYSFDGVDDHLTFSQRFIFNQNGDAALSLWIKSNLLPNNNQGSYLYSTTSSVDSNRFNFRLNVNSSSHLRLNLDYRESSQTIHTLNTYENLAVNSWTQVIYSRIGHNYSLYVDGTLIGTVADNSPNLPTATGWVLGKMMGTSHNFSGSIDDIRIYDRALSAAEVAALYQLENTPPNQAPVFADANATFTTAENNASANFVVTATDPDANTTLAYTKSGPDAGKFTLNVATGTLTFTNTPDYEANASAAGNNTFSLTITVTDGEANATQTVTFNVTNMVEDFDFDGIEDHFDHDDDDDGFSDTAEIAYGSDPRNSQSLANAAPQDIDLNGTTVAENQPVGTIVGDFNATDPDPDSNHTFAFTDGNGSTHNHLFTSTRIALSAPRRFSTTRPTPHSASA